MSTLPKDQSSAEADLISEINKTATTGKFVSTVLRTDERVIARVTDGIYRQPGSAFRELISNAYDADATRVVINTDAPRFEKITIEDDGRGMSTEVLAYLLRHIGGSAKRNEEGRAFNITSLSDLSRSPKGRPLIGKIGIGLFSVSQLTHTFQIVTKVTNDPYRTIATVTLKQYQDDAVDSSVDGKHKFESGQVNIWREKASDLKAHGTTIVLTSIRPQARDTLRSRDIWGAIEQEEDSLQEGDSSSLEPPKYHIGRLDKSGKTLQDSGALPWAASDGPEIAFSKLVQSVWEEIGVSSPNPKLDEIFDSYLRMVWQLALATPLPYVDGHIFDLTSEKWEKAYLLSNQLKGSATPLTFAIDETARQKLELSNDICNQDTFDVYFDNLKLARPIKFRNLPATSNAIQKPLTFFGKCREEFSKVPRELSGGPIDFEAYLLWTPKVAPTEHQGSLIRIHGSSGTLFDSTFMRYQVSEQTRLRQITCEIFVHEGLDSALNIDRESFNNAHPHAVYLSKWLHGALRQLATAQKRIAGEIRELGRTESRSHAVSEIQRVANEIWVQEMGDPVSLPPSINIGDKEAAAGSDTYLYNRAAIIPSSLRLSTSKRQSHDNVIEAKLKAIAQVLASYGLLDAIPKRKQEKLLMAIYKILDAPEE